MIGRVCHLLRMQAPVVDNRGLLYLSGATVPTDGTDGYQTGCLFQHTDGDNNTSLYVNEGSVTSCEFNSVTTGGPVDGVILGTFSSLEAGYGIPISSDQTGAVLIYSDDVGVNIDASVRGFLSRFLLTFDQSGGSIRAVMGQLKLATGVDVATGIYTASQGYVELAGSHTVSSGATLSCFDASLEVPSGGTVTVDSGGELAGLHVETTGAGTITNNGTCAGILISNASGAPDWPLGLYMIGADVIEGIRIGAFHSTAQSSGVGLKTAVSAANRFYSDDAGAAIVNTGVNDTRGVLSRVLATVDHSANELRLFALEGQIKSYDGIWGNEMVAGVYGYLELVRNSATLTLTDYGFTAGVMSCVENTGIVTVNTNHVLSGFCAVSKIKSTLVATGKTAAFHAAIYDGTNWSSSGEDETAWEYGLYIASGAVSAVGVEIAAAATDGVLVSGACTDGIELSGDMTNAINISAGNTPTVGLLVAGAAATGISITGVCTSLGIGLTSQTAEMITGSTTITLSGAHRNAVSITAISPANAAYQLRGIYTLVYPSTGEQATTRLVGVHAEVQTALNTYSVMPIYGYINCSAAKSIAAESAAVMGDINIDNAIGMTGRLAAVHAKVRGDSALTGSLDCIHADAEMSVDTVIYCNVDTSMTATVGVSLSGAGTYTTGVVLNATAMGTGISIAACTTAAIDILGDQVIGILCNVDEDWTDALKISVDTSKTLTEGIEMSGAGAVTTGINISVTACTTGIAISAGSLTDGIKISGTTPADGVEVSSVCSGGAFHVSGASASGLLIASSCTTAGINITAANLNCIKSVFNVGAQLGQYVQGIKMEHTRSADIQPSTGGWWGAQIVLNAGTGYTALDKTAYVLHCVFKGDATNPSAQTVNVARFETQSNGKVEDLLFVSANSGSTVEGDVARFVAHVAPTRAILAVQNGTAGSTPMGICVDIDETMTTGIQFNTGAAITNLLQITAAANTSYFLIADAEAGCLPNYSSAGSAIANLKVKIGSTDGYIKIYDAA